jgi:hypothetical protein
MCLSQHSTLFALCICRVRICYVGTSAALGRDRLDTCLSRTHFSSLVGRERDPGYSARLMRVLLESGVREHVLFCGHDAIVVNGMGAG